VVLSLWAALSATAVAPIEISVEVDGQARTALVYPGAEASDAPAPLLFVFHGFTSSPSLMAALSRMHEAWPAATVVYPLGLPLTSVSLNATGPGWVCDPRTEANRDLRFTDALLARLRTMVRVDAARTYAAGYSNGGQFAYLLLTVRPQRFAAIAAVACGTSVVWRATVPRPVLAIHGATDGTVPASWAIRSCEVVRRLNRCAETPVTWADGYILYPSEVGAPVVWSLHGGGHSWPGDATASIVRFLKPLTLPTR